MKQTYDNDKAMFETVRDFMNGHTTETASIPAIVSTVSELSALITQIDNVMTAQSTPLTGITQDKEALRTALEEAVFAVSEPLAALAAATNNNTLLAEVEISRSALDDLSADAVDAFATRVATRATTNQTVLTGQYGVSIAQVAAITSARTAFAPWVNKPRTAISERAGQTATIPVLIRQGKALLNTRLDRLMNRFRTTNPTLHAAYRVARTIVDRRAKNGSNGANGTNGTNGSAVTSAAAA